MLVLPPIPTTGLTASDVPALAARVRDQMLETLREISIVPSGRPEKSEETTRDIPQSPSITPPSVDSNPFPTKELPSNFAGVEANTGSSMSIASSFSSNLSQSSVSENGAETEEDEGMILVGRPT